MRAQTLVFSNIFPFLSWKRHYTLEYLIDDALAGLTLATAALPQSLAHALLTSLPANVGLYTTIIPAVIQPIFGRHPFSSYGPFAVVSLMIANALLSTVEVLKEQFPDVIVPIGDETEPYLQYPIMFHMSDLLSFGVGSLCLIATIFDIPRRLDYFLPDKLISGFTVAAAISIVTSQISSLLGLHIRSKTGTFVIIKKCLAIIQNLGSTNLLALCIGLATISIIFTMEKLDVFVIKNKNAIKQHILYRLGKVDELPPKFEFVLKDTKPSGLPKVFFTVVLITMISYLGSFGKHYGVPLVGPIPSGFPDFNVPWRIFYELEPEIANVAAWQLIPSMFSISLVAYCTLKSVLQTFPAKLIDSVESVETCPSNRPINEVIPGLLAAEEPIVVEVLNNVENSGEQTNSPKPWPIVIGEMILLSVSSIACSFFSGIVPSPSLSRSAVLATQTPAKTPLASSFSGLLMLFAVFFLTKLIAYVPLSCLSGVVVYALKGTLMKFKNGVILGKKLKEDRSFDSFQNFFQWCITFMSVVILDPSLGIMVGICLNQTMLFIVYIKNKRNQSSS